VLGYLLVGSVGVRSRVNGSDDACLHDVHRPGWCQYRLTFRSYAIARLTKYDR